MQSKSRAKRSAANTAWQREATYSMLHSSETQLSYGEQAKQNNDRNAIQNDAQQIKALQSKTNQRDANQCNAKPRTPA